MKMIKDLKNNMFLQTNGIGEYELQDGNFKLEIMECITKHMNNDFGDLCPEDKDMNLKALESDLKYDRVLSRYTTSKGDIYIITELYDIDSDMYSTTVLFTDEY